MKLDGNMTAEQQNYIVELGRYLRELFTKGVEQAEPLRPTWQGSVTSESRETTETMELLQRFLDQALAAYAHQKQIGNGNLAQPIEKGNMLAMPLKALQANLLHLIWQAEQIAGGDYNQRVHCLGGFSAAFNTMTEKLKERERLQAEKQQLQTQLFQSQKLESISRLAAGMAHEINTPAHFITLNLEFIEQSFADISSCIEQIHHSLAESEEKSCKNSLCQLEESLKSIEWDYIADEVPKALSQSQGGIARVASIVNSLKELAQPSKQDSTRADINRLITETVAVSIHEWNRVVKITTEVDEALPPVAGTESELRQVLFNLIVNGAQAVEEKMRLLNSSEKGLIRVQSRLVDNLAHVTVQDSGKGIEQEYIAKVFDPFFTTKEVGQGTGQGLTVVYDIIVNKHKGAITVDSNVGQGTTITIKLPLWPIV